MEEDEGQQCARIEQGMVFMEGVIIKWQGKSKRQVCVNHSKNLISKTNILLSVCIHFIIHATSFLTADRSAVLSYSFCFFKNNTCRSGGKRRKGCLITFGHLHVTQFCLLKFRIFSTFLCLFMPKLRNQKLNVGC
jgi:hypothetical protein